MSIDITAALPRITALVRMLGSDNDGEALNAIRAIGKALARAGGSFHDLAERIEAPAARPLRFGEARPEHWEAPPRARWEDILRESDLKKNRRGQTAPLFQTMSPHMRESLMRAAISSGKLDTWGMQFLGDILHQHETSATIEVSPRQLEQINRLFAQVWAVGVRP